MSAALHNHPSWDTPTQPGIHSTEPAPLDCPAVQQHLDEQRHEFRAAMARIAQAIHPDDTVPATLHVPTHTTQAGDRWHELGHKLMPWAALTGMAVVAYLMLIGVIQ